MKNNQFKLYNVLFPVWFFGLIPQLWIIVLPGNFLIDSLVLLISMYALKITDKKGMYKKFIVKIFCFGLLADFIGTAFMFLTVYIFELGTMGDELYLTIPAVVLAGGLIFVFNYFFTFRKTDKVFRYKLSLIFALATAPYTFMIPSGWIYGY